MILNGKRIVVARDESQESGYKIFALEGDDMIDCYIARKDKQTGYYRVYIGNSYQARNGDVEYYYLHRIVYAYYCDWRSTDIQEGYHVHHILHNKEIKEDSRKFNHISNLIYIDSRTHTHLHYLEKQIIKLSMKAERTEEENEQLQEFYAERLKIIKKYCAIRDNRLNKVGKL